MTLIPKVRCRAEVVVLDNCADESLDWLTVTYDDLGNFVEPKKGAANVRNRDVLGTAAQTLIFLDCDCVPAEGWLDVALSRSGCIDIVGGEVFVFDECS